MLSEKFEPTFVNLQSTDYGYTGWRLKSVRNIHSTRTKQSIRVLHDNDINPNHIVFPRHPPDDAIQYQATKKTQKTKKKDIKQNVSRSSLPSWEESKSWEKKNTKRKTNIPEQEKDICSQQASITKEIVIPEQQCCLSLLGSSLLFWRGGLFGGWLGGRLCDATRLGDSLNLGLVDNGRGGCRGLARLGCVGLGLSSGLLGGGGLLCSRLGSSLLGGGGLLCGGSLGGSGGLL